MTGLTIRSIRLAALSIGFSWTANVLSVQAQPIRLNAGAIDTTPSVSPSPERLAARTRSGRQLHLVQFDGPIRPEWVDALLQGGFQIVDYIPDNAYLVYGDAGARRLLAAPAQRLPYLRWEGPYLPSDKIHPRARPEAAPARRAATGQDDGFAVQLVLDPPVNAETVALIESLSREPFPRDQVFRHYRNLVVRMDPAEVATVAARPDVISIHPYVPPRRLCERQAMIVAGQLAGSAPSGPGYLDWLAAQGLTADVFDGSGMVVDVCDSGVDNGSVNVNHFGLYASGDTGQISRVVYSRLEGRANFNSTAQGCDGHGTLNAHILAGYNNRTNGFPHQDAAGFRYGLGIAPYVRIGASVIFDPEEYTFPDLAAMAARIHADGARISCNSWGANVGGAYDLDAQVYDALVRDAHPDPGNQEMTYVFAAGNAGPNWLSINSPGSAKNVITVGASENVQAIGGTDGSGVDDTGADDVNDMIDFSSRGPCLDGRLKPELVAPGTRVSGGVAQQTRTMAGSGAALPCFDGKGISGGPGGFRFFPTNQQWYSVSSGTSHATPAVAGAAALVRQHFLNQGRPAPSPAMVKAFLVHSARYLTGEGANDDLWSPSQGMGRLDLGKAFDPTSRILRDQHPDDIFTASGQSRTFTGVVADPARPVRITLSWTDAPGSTAGAAYNNDLDLLVVAEGRAYHGNVFRGAFSVPGGEPDPRNNTESVFLPAGLTGVVAVVVTAANITSDGIPNQPPALDQDFALVIYNLTEAPAPAVYVEQMELLRELCPNGAIDPDETVTVAFSLRNAGSVDAANVVATLLPTGGVTEPSAPKRFGALPDGGVAVARPFVFTAAGLLGETLTATLALEEEEGGHLGYATYSFVLGATPPAGLSITNAEFILLNDYDKASPYPSILAVSNFNGVIANVTVTLHGFGHDWPGDMDMILVSPAGQAVSLMSRAGGSESVAGVTVTFDDQAPGPLVEPMVSGRYRPSGMAGPMRLPAPQPPYGFALADFQGSDPNGDWRLYAEDTFFGDSGQIENGWSIHITTVDLSLCLPEPAPPVLHPIGDFSVLFGRPLQFAVAATPTDGDTVALSASNLPPGAVFTPTNQSGSFWWPSAGPAGSYAVTFSATDKDGSDQETIWITVPSAPAFEKMVVFFGVDAIASFDSIAGQLYRLETTLDLTATPVVWTVAATAIGTGDPMILSDPFPTEIKRYYRLVAP